MSSLKVWWSILAGVTLLFCGCDTNDIIDTNVEMPSHIWSYSNRVKTIVEVADPSQPLNIYFKVRNTNNYRYSNIFILLHISGGGMKKHTRRFQCKLAEVDGKWTGSGSGNLFTNVVPLLTDYKFPNKGKFLLEIEQNMRDNPLHEISDAGIKVSK